MNLKQYKEKHNMSLRALSALLDINYSVISRYISGERTPRYSTIVAIEKKTKGKVRVASWMTLKSKEK